MKKKQKVKRPWRQSYFYLQIRLDEAEANSMKGGKRQLQKMEQRVRELEVEVDAENRRHQDATKAMRKQDRRLKVRGW